MDKIKVIIAEDTKATRRFYDKVLSDTYYEKKFAINGKEALEYYEEWDAEILILDMLMPIMSGYSVLKKIREEKDYYDDNTTIIMATSKATSHDVRHCAQFDIQGYIVKPFRLKEFEQQILTAFARKKPERVKELEEYKATFWDDDLPPA